MERKIRGNAALLCKDGTYMEKKRSEIAEASLHCRKEIKKQDIG